MQVSNNSLIVYDGKKFLKYTFIIGIVLLSISIFRALTTSITYDEAYTYVNYISTDLKGIIRPLFTKGTILANNHYLNSFLISMLDIITGIKYNEFLIRLPNIFFYIVYLIFSYKIASKYRHKYLFFNLLVFNYGVHEFFGLARGYGMACSLTLIGMYFLKLWLKDTYMYDNLNICYYALLLSCYANSIGLIGFACVIIYSQIYILLKSGIKENISYVKTQFLKILPIFPALAIIIRYHFKISSDGLPLYGGKDGFFNSVIVSGVELFGISDKISLFVTCILIMILIISMILKRKDIFKFGPHILFFMYLILLVIFTKISGKIWITGRELIPLYPIFAYSLFELTDRYEFKYKYLEYILACFVCIPFIINFNLNQTRSWSDNYVAKSDSYDLFDNNKHMNFDEFKNSYSYKFYRDKILYYHNYDIFYKSK